MTIQTESPVGTDLTLDTLLRKMVENGASDLHLAVGSPPHNRLDGKLIPLSADLPVLDQGMMEKILFVRLDADQMEKLQTKRELDFSVSVPGLSRFRGNILWQRGTLGSVFRSIPSRPLTLAELQLPPIIEDLCNRPRGLVLVTGPTGSGKSTTLAAMIDHINSHHEGHIVTIEDPIEFLHKNKKCIVRQRELGADTLSFAAALKHVLRQDPDVILVGEMRDLETIGLAVTAAETGHLVFGTLHTTSAATTVDRVIDVFPAGQQQQIRMQLSSTLQGVVSQTLIPKAEGKGRCCAMEIMIGTNGVRNLIREGKTHQINNQIQAGMSAGMQSLNHALKLLVQRGDITAEAALQKSNAPDELRGFLGLPMQNL
ncbi:MAG: type IV pilus twitching motility protein PilT [Candidatus Eremiobacterota bacterium]